MKKRNLHNKKIQKETLEPIIIVHGYPDDNTIKKGINLDSILNAMKIIAINGYESLLKNMYANDVVTLTVSQLEESKHMKTTGIRGAILMNNEGKVGCVSALTTLDHPILLARRLLNETQDIIIIQENMEGKQVSDMNHYSTVSDDNDDVYLSDIQSWSVIARDRNENLAGGRSTWTFKKDEEPSINVMMSVPGCGLLVDDKSCCSVSGNEKMIYVDAPARKIMQQLKGITSNTALNYEINCFMNQQSNPPKAVVYLGTNNEPLIVNQSEYFPWAYCHQGILKYGYANNNKSFSEKISLSVALNCRCKR